MFWIISAILILVALAFILPSLWNRNTSQDATREQNIAIAQEQLAELEARFENGEISEDGYQTTRDEIEQSLFNDMEISEDHLNITTPQDSSRKPLFSTIFILLLIPLISISLYIKKGNLVFTKQLDSNQAAQQATSDLVPKNADGSPDIDTMVARLQQKMNDNPDNPKGWYMLGRSYMVLKKYPEAAKSFDRAYKLMPESADTILSLADALSMSNNGQLTGRPTKLVTKALSIEPQNITALWLSGMASRQQGDYLTAITQWQKVIPLILDKPQEVVEVEKLINDAKKNLSPDQQQSLSKKTELASTAKVKEKQSGKGIKVSVSISSAMQEQVSPNDLVFIYAKAMSGPPMPLAALRKQVKDLPIDIELNDDMAMMPNLKLSSFPEVIVGARVSKTGRPIAQDGDLYSEQSSIKAGDKVSLEINTVLSK
jgi:cytochrome c-type biogenesis protein CcmH